MCTDYTILEDLIESHRRSLRFLTPEDSASEDPEMENLQFNAVEDAECLTQESFAPRAALKLPSITRLCLPLHIGSEVRTI